MKRIIVVGVLAVIIAGCTEVTQERIDQALMCYNNKLACPRMFTDGYEASVDMDKEEMLKLVKMHIKKYGTDKTGKELERELEMRQINREHEKRKREMEEWRKKRNTPGTKEWEWKQRNEAKREAFITKCMMEYPVTRDYNPKKAEWDCESKYTDTLIAGEI